MGERLLSGGEFHFDCYLPYYLQLKSYLGETIDSGVLSPGDRLPSEAELCSEFRVSRTVVRQALKDMEYEGRIIKRKGKGSYVAEPKILESFVQTLSGFHDDMTSQMRTTHSRVLRCELARAPNRIARILQVKEGTKVVVLSRLRFVDNDPIQLVTSFIPLKLCPDLPATDFSNRSLYGFLEEHDIFIARGFRTIEAVRATDEEARQLGVESGSPMIRIESVGYTADGTPVEYFEAVHRGDRTRFRVELVRERVGGDRLHGSDASSGIELLPAETSRRPR